MKTTRQIAREMGYGLRHVIKECHAGRLKAVKVLHNGRLRFEIQEADYQAWRSTLTDPRGSTGKRPTKARR